MAIQCPLCSSRDARFVFQVKKYKLMSCKECDLFFIDPYPEKSKTHKSVPTYGYQDLTIVDPSSHFESSIIFYNQYYPLIKKECENARSILDVGCGTGRLLQLLVKENSVICATGIELNIERAIFAKRVTGCEILQVPIESLNSDKKYDVICMMNVLSHISSFNDLFDSLHSLLAPNGKVILKVGEMTKDVKKNAVFDWGVPDHLHFLGMKTLEYLCKKYKFKILRHDRTFLSKEMFSKYRWQSPGRSNVRNIIKTIVVAIPFALRVLDIVYNIRHGNSIYSSFIILKPDIPFENITDKT